MSVVNAHIIYNDRQVAAGNKKLPITKFRELLCVQLLHSGSVISVPLQSQSGDQTTMANHYLEETYEKEGGRRTDRRKRRSCVGCYDRLSSVCGREFAKKG
jgi:hypothetical protein